MSEGPDVTVQAVTAEASAAANPPSVRIEPALRLTLLGVLVTVGLGVDAVVVSAGVSWWVALLAGGGGSFAATACAIHFRPTRRLLARFGAWVLPDEPG
jgi:hypothetical protein